jgi:hypothetical protein
VLWKKDKRILSGKESGTEKKNKGSNKKKIHRKEAVKKGKCSQADDNTFWLSSCA